MQLSNTSDAGLIVGRSGPENQASEKQMVKDRWFNSREGFFILPRAIRDDATLTNAEFRILVSLASFIYKHDQVHPSLETLRVITGMSVGAISKNASSLEKKGWLKKERRPYTSVLYTLVLPEKYKKEAGKDVFTATD